jgi:hypothetical protein
MNYRRGFQRLFLVCVILWIGSVLSISLMNRPQPINDIELHLENGTVLHFPLGTDPAVMDSVIKRQSPPNGVTLVDSPIRSSLRYWERRWGIAFLPPALFYFFLFLVAPWISQGFRSATHI